MYHNSSSSSSTTSSTGFASTAGAAAVTTRSSLSSILRRYLPSRESTVKEYQTQSEDEVEDVSLHNTSSTHNNHPQQQFQGHQDHQQDHHYYNESEPFSQLKLPPISDSIIPSQLEVEVVSTSPSSTNYTNNNNSKTSNNNTNNNNNNSLSRPSMNCGFCLNDYLDSTRCFTEDTNLTVFRSSSASTSTSTSSNKLKSSNKSKLSSSSNNTNNNLDLDINMNRANSSSFSSHSSNNSTPTSSPVKFKSISHRGTYNSKSSRKSSFTSADTSTTRSSSGTGTCTTSSLSCTPIRSKTNSRSPKSGSRTRTRTKSGGSKSNNNNKDDYESLLTNMEHNTFDVEYATTDSDDIDINLNPPLTTFRKNRHATKSSTSHSHSHLHTYSPSSTSSSTSSPTKPLMVAPSSIDVSERYNTPRRRGTGSTTGSIIGSMTGSMTITPARTNKKDKDNMSLINTNTSIDNNDDLYVSPTTRTDFSLTNGINHHDIASESDDDNDDHDVIDDDDDDDYSIFSIDDDDNSDDDDCTVKISNMRSTQQLNAQQQGNNDTTNSNTKNDTNANNKKKKNDTTTSHHRSSSTKSSTKSSSSFFCDIEPNHILEELRKEWDGVDITPPPSNPTSPSSLVWSSPTLSTSPSSLPVGVVGTSSSNSNSNSNSIDLPPTNNKEKKKKNVLQKTSRKVKKILGTINNNTNTNPNSLGNSNDYDSFRSNDAIAGNIPPRTRSYSSSAAATSGSLSKSDRYTDAWLKKMTNGEEILLKDSQENILMGTPLKIGRRGSDVSGSSGKNNANSNGNGNSNGNINSPFKVIKSSSFAFGSSPIKIKKTKSDLLTKVGIGSPTRKITNMMTNRKHKRTLSNQSSIFLSNTAHPDSSSSSNTSPQRILQRFQRGHSNSNGSNNTAAAEALPWNVKDDAIKGRLDGIDVLSLGPTRCVSYIGAKQKSLAGQRYTLRSMVSDTLWSSSGREFPEIVLEGFSPTGKDRWTVLIEDDVDTHASLSENNRTSSIRQQKMRQRNLEKKKEKASNRQESSRRSKGKKEPPLDLLLTQIWGKEGAPPPTHSVKFERAGGGDEMEGGIRAISSCPVDLQKDIFIIKEDDHLQSAHSIAVVNLKYGRFDESITVFEKILRSLQHEYKNRDHHLVGGCHHNLGVLQMWTGNYELSLDHFDKAIANRMKTMSLHHPSVAVSLAKVGLAYFALEQLDKALESLEKALDIRNLYKQHGNLEVAKLHNNIAAIHYQKGDKKTALKHYNEALEIMKKLIEGPVRRESLVYDTAIILCNMGKIYLEKKNYEMAYRMLEEALMVQTSTFRKIHDCILTSLGNIAFARGKEGETIKSLQVYKSLFRMQVEKFGSTSCEAIETKGLMSVLYIKMAKYKEANRCLKEVLKWQHHNLDKHHPALTNTKETIKKLRQAIKGARESFADI